MRTIMVALVAFTVLASIVGLNFLEGQTMGEGQVMKLLKEFIALVPSEIPCEALGFKVTGSIVNRSPTGSIWLIQGLRRRGTGIVGRDPAEVIMRLHLYSNRNIAYEAAVLMTTSQYAPIGQPGMPEGSLTGLPIGEKSWATAPKAEKPAPGLGTAGLVVWDDRLALEVLIDYQPIDPKARTAIFLPIADEDLELGELAARLILAKANLVLLGWHDLPKLRLVVNGASLQAREHQGDFFVPVTSTLNHLGVNWERKLVLLSFHGGGRR